MLIGKGIVENPDRLARFYKPDRSRGHEQLSPKDRILRNDLELQALGINALSDGRLHGRNPPIGRRSHDIRTSAVDLRDPLFRRGQVVSERLNFLGHYGR